MLYQPITEGHLVKGRKFPIFRPENDEDFYSFIIRMHEEMNCRYSGSGAKGWLEKEPENTQMLWMAVLQLLEISLSLVVPKYNTFKKENATNDSERYINEPVGHWCVRLLNNLPGEVSTNINTLIEYELKNGSHYLITILDKLKEIIREIKQAEEQRV
jgi:hypothetical protein